MLFDIGGVLEMTPDTGWREAWCERLNIDRSEMDEKAGAIWRAGGIGSVTLDEVRRGTAEALGLTADELRELFEDIWQEYLGTLNTELADFFTGLRPRYRTGILSNSFVGARERERLAYNFEAMCDVVVYSHEEGMQKPDARFFRLVCERLGVAPEDVVFVDDAEVCVDAARGLGMKVVRFVDNDQVIGDIMRYLGESRTWDRHIRDGSL